MPEDLVQELPDVLADDVGVLPANIDEDGRPIIIIRDSERPRVVDEAIRAIQHEVFQRGGELFRILGDGEDATLTQITAEAVDLMLNKAVCFQREVIRGRGEERGLVLENTCAPTWLAKLLVKLQQWPAVRPLNALAFGPFLDAKGRVAGHKKGYDVATGVWTATDFYGPQIPHEPTDADAIAALEKLKKVVAEFPFDDDTGFSVYLAAILTILARNYLNAVRPAFLFAASAPGSGKTLLAKVVGIIGAGKEPGAFTPTTDRPDEARKQITAFLQSGEPILFFDNLSGQFGGSDIDRLITTQKWTDRPLYSAQSVTLDVNLTILATGNNLGTDRETSRRCVALRIAPACENPSGRTFAIPDLRQYAVDNQQELAAAGLTILRWHIAKECPPRPPVIIEPGDGSRKVTEIATYGGFERWSMVVRHAVLQLGLPDPVNTPEITWLEKEATSPEETFITYLAAWRPGWEGSAKDLYHALYVADDDAEEAEDVREALNDLIPSGESDVKQRPTSSQIGYALRGVRDRYFSGHCLAWLKSSGSGVVWQLRSLTPK